MSSYFYSLGMLLADIDNPHSRNVAYWLALEENQ